MYNRSCTTSLDVDSRPHFGTRLRGEPLSLVFFHNSYFSMCLEKLFTYFLMKYLTGVQLWNISFGVNLMSLEELCVVGEGSHSHQRQHSLDLPRGMYW